LQKILIIAGPTAAGKTETAIKLASETDGEIINADAMQVYRHLDIGTCKPSPDELKKIRHHLISIINPDEEMNAGLFVRYADIAVKDIISRNKNPLVVGGTGLYLRALTKGLSEIPPVPAEIREKIARTAAESGIEVLYKRLLQVDPQTAKNLKPSDTQRIIRACEVFEAHGKPISFYHSEFPCSGISCCCLKIFLTMERKRLYQRIDRRVDEMLEKSFCDEVKKLLSMGYGIHNRALRSPGYFEVIKFLNGDFSYDEMAALIKKKHRNYAKRQFTWFKKEKDYKWKDAENFEEILNLARNFIIDKKLQGFDLSPLRAR
jgi:tRNA dimethylallyltransferase